MLSFSPFQDKPVGHPANGDDVCPISAFALKIGSFAAEARHRWKPRSHSFLVEEVRSLVRIRNPEKAGTSTSISLELVLAPRRGFCESNSVQHYLWRAVELESDVPECFVTKRRDRTAAPKLLKKEMKW